MMACCRQVDRLREKVAEVAARDGSEASAVPVRRALTMSPVLSPNEVEAQTLNDDDQPRAELAASVRFARAKPTEVIRAQLLEDHRVAIHRVRRADCGALRQPMTVVR
jgi:hypothetical protein